MGKSVPPIPVKLLTGVLCTDEAICRMAQMILEAEFGPVDYISSRFQFDLTNYYEREMGNGLGRWFWSFQKLIDPGRLPEIKLFTNAVEMQLAEESNRRINLDPGYLDFHKLILASVKERAQKIYLSHGIYADPTLFFLKGRFYFYDWSLPDFKTDAYLGVFAEIREIYRQNLRSIDPHSVRYIGFDDSGLLHD